MPMYGGRGSEIERHTLAKLQANLYRLPTTIDTPVPYTPRMHQLLLATVLFAGVDQVRRVFSIAPSRSLATLHGPHRRNRFASITAAYPSATRSIRMSSPT